MDRLSLIPTKFITNNQKIEKWGKTTPYPQKEKKLSPLYLATIISRKPSTRKQSENLTN
jgi:hypothetical protein